MVQVVQTCESKPRMPVKVCGLGTIREDLVPEEGGFTSRKYIQAR